MERYVAYLFLRISLLISRHVVADATGAIICALCAVRRDSRPVNIFYSLRLGLTNHIYVFIYYIIAHCLWSKNKCEHLWTMDNHAIS